MKLLFRGLARNTSEETMSQLLAAHGTVQYCTIVVDDISGKSKGFGFAEMPKVGEAKAAIKQLNNQEVDGNKIRVKKADAAATASKQPDSANPPEKSSPYGRKNLLD